MLSLTDDQLATVLAAAEPLTPSDRGKFLEDVAAALATVPVIGDGLVARTVPASLRQPSAPRRCKVAQEAAGWRGIVSRRKPTNLS